MKVSTLKFKIFLIKKVRKHFKYFAKPKFIHGVPLYNMVADGAVAQVNVFSAVKVTIIFVLKTERKNKDNPN